MYLLPKPQNIELHSGFLAADSFIIKNFCKDPRIEKASKKLPLSDTGVELEIYDREETGEGYTLQITPSKVTITGQSPAGAFYGIQTLRQILENTRIPCLTITDYPGFSYRGFYHDVTRGKIPTVSTLKTLIDKMAFCKLNSLQLYIEHAFPFREFGEYAEKNGYLTPEEILELDDYCYDNFIEFIPSIATFGHLYELLQLEKYKHLQELENYEEDQLYWYQRMLHHTIDPTMEQSFEIIKSMIDQYIPLFRSDKFNICCDETFDLKNGKHKETDTARLYIDFVKKIVDHVQSKGKKVMMWADILLQHPQTIHELPKNVDFLNWDYSACPKKDAFEKFSQMGYNQIVCPGTSSWNRLVEGIDVGSRNILALGDYGYKYHAKGMLNTNWGDYGNPCSLELSMHGLVLGASKSWNQTTCLDSYFTSSINYLIYKHPQATHYLTLLDKLQEKLPWQQLAFCYSNRIHDKKFMVKYPAMDDIKEAQTICSDIINVLQAEIWEEDEYRQEILMSAEGLMVMAELFSIHAGYHITLKSDPESWLKKYCLKWLKKNKPSELYRIKEMFAVLTISV